ncbi:MAG: Gfo/Idh/MocA family protein [Anaerolineales bacterium]
MGEDLRLAVVGLGGIAEKAYLPLLSSWPSLKLLACSRSPETVANHLQRYPFQQGTIDLEELIDWGPKAALVLSPNPTHFEITKKLLEGGVDTFVEKPLTMSSEASAELTAIAQKRERVLMVAFNRRFAPVHQWVKKRWGDRPVRYALLEKHRPEPVHADLETNYIDDVIHQVDLMRYFCGEAKPLSTQYTERNGRQEGAYSSLSLASGGLAVIATSRAAGRWREHYEIHGDGVSVYVEAFEKARWIDQGGERHYGVEEIGSWSSHLMIRGFEGELKHFFQCIETRQRPRTSAEESARTQRLLEGLLQVAERV